MVRLLGSADVVTFQISKYEVMWSEWQDVRAWAISNGYADLAGVGMGTAADHPVRGVSWFDVVKWCNARSEREGLIPVYRVAGAIYRFGKSIPDVNALANGYRLPSLDEWMYASRGGLRSRGYYFSGSDNLDDVAWDYWNSIGAPLDLWNGRGTWPVGMKAANEAGIHDMGGNVFEWVGTAKGTGDTYSSYRYYTMGGSWSTSYESAFYHQFTGNDGAPDSRGNATGFRAARNAQ